MSRAIRVSGRQDEAVAIDLTPMLDVVFIMLIFFIVTASFLKFHSIAVNIPEGAPSQAIPNKSPTVFLIDSSNAISLDGRRVDIRSVRALIAQREAEIPGRAVVVSADQQAATKTYVHIADAARQAGVANVSLVSSGR